MINKKKLIASVLSMMALFSLASCVSEKSSSSIPTQTTEAPSKPSETSSPTTPSVPTTTTTTTTTTETTKQYTFKEFRWATDYSTATLVMVASDNEEKTIAATVTSVTVDATCEENGKTTYTANASYDGHNYSDTKEVAIAALGHDWDLDNIVWNWSNDYSSATATLTCKNDDTHKDIINANITSSTTATCEAVGTKTYTATITIGNQDYTDIVEVAEEPLGHNYEFSEFVWSNDGTTAQAKYVCSRDNAHIVYYNATMTSAVKTPATCTAKGVTRYTATYDGHTDTNDVENINALGHNYVYDRFEWSTATEPYTAMFVVVCTRDASHSNSYVADIVYEVITPATQTAEGEGRYTASYTYENVFYKETRTVVIPQTAVYEFKEFVWNTSVDPYTAQARYTDKNGFGQDVYYDATVTYEVTAQPTCTVFGVGTYRATYDTHSGTKTVQIPATGHDWDLDNIVWSWATDYSSATATLTCKTDSNHTDVRNASITSSTTATCETAGTKTYTASITVGGVTKTDERSVPDPAKGHEWNLPTYQWNADNTQVTATRTCKSDPNHKETETVDTVVQKTVATKTTTGTATFTGTFTNPAFEEQTKNVTLYYVMFVDKDGNPTSADNVKNDVMEGSLVSYTPIVGTYNGFPFTFNNPYIDTDGSIYETYVFNGWIANDDTTIFDINNTPITEQTIFKPKYTKYTVTKNIDAAGTVGDMFSSDVLSSASTTYVPLSGTTKSGYMFLGWYQTIDGVTTSIKIPSSSSSKKNYMTVATYYITGTSDVEIEARWMALPLTITNNTPTYGTVTYPTSSWINHSETITATTNTGYIFKGFYDGSTLAVKDPNTNLPLSSFTITMSTDTNINYEAIWVQDFMTFNVNDASLGSISNVESYVYGETKTITATPKTGYSFVKWQKDGVDYAITPSIDVVFTEANGGTYTAVFKSVTLQTNVVLYNQSTGLYEASTEAGTVNNNAYSTATNVTIGQNIVFNVVPGEGYTFQGLYIDDVLLTSNNYTMPATDVVVEARFVAYTITTTNDTPTYGTISEFTDKKVVQGGTVTLTATPKPGYSFLGWYESSTATNPANTSTSWAITMPNQNLSYVAKFSYFTITISSDDNTHGTAEGINESNSVVVSFNLNGGTGDIPDQVVTLTDALVYPGEVTKENYAFNGWYVDQLCTERFDFTSVLNKDTVLYAGFTPMYNDASYNTQAYADLFRNNTTSTTKYSLLLDGSSSSNTNNLYFICYQTGDIDIYVRSTSSSSANTNHIRIYNITDSLTDVVASFDTSSQSYNSGTISVHAGDVICIKDYISSGNTGVKTDIYVTGNTLPVPTAVCGGLEYNNMKITKGTEVTLVATPEAGYSFDGWYVYGTTTNPVTTNPWVFNMGSESLNYVAKFSSYKLTTETEFKDTQVAGTITTPYNDQAITAGTQITLKATLNSGFTFLGWFKEGETTPISTNLECQITMPNETVKYIAKYTYYALTISSNDTSKGTVGGVSDGNFVTVTFNMNGARESYAAQEVTSTVALTYPGNPTKAGYIFTGWYSDALCTNRFDFGENITEDTTIYAGFSQLTNAGTIVDITIDNVNTVSQSSTKSYTYFVAPNTGNYVIYYRLSANQQVNLVFKKDGSSTSIIEANINRVDATWYTEMFSANAGDVFVIESRQPDNIAVQLEFYVKLYDNNYNELIPYNPISTVLCGPLAYNDKKITGGTSVTLVATPKAGYTFVGWFKDGATEAISINASYTITISELTEGSYVAKFEAQ